MTDVCIKQRKERPREKKVHDDGGRDESDAATSHGMLGSPEDGRGREGSSPRASGESTALLAP